MARPDEFWVVVNDLQVPFHSPAAVDVAAQLIKAIRPTHLVFNGDILDNDAISAHKRRRNENLRGLSLQDELDRTVAVTDKLRESAPGATYIHLDGNHEDRLERYLGTDAKELGSLQGLTIPELLKLKDRGFSEYRSYPEGIHITPDLMVTHGEAAVRTHGASVRAEIDKAGCSVIIGHCHRAAKIRFPLLGRELVGIENGCLCKLDPSYTKDPQWSWAISAVSVFQGGKRFVADMLDIVPDHRSKQVFAHWSGKEYRTPANYDDGLAVPWRVTKHETYS